MKMPIIVLSYGIFSGENKRLFSYDNSNNSHIMPIFTDPTIAAVFASSMRTAASITERLIPQVCIKYKNAINMFTTISLLAPDLKTIVIDPTPITENGRQKLTEAGIFAQDKDIDIGLLIEELQIMEKQTMEESNDETIRAKTENDTQQMR